MTEQEQLILGKGISEYSEVIQRLASKLIEVQGEAQTLAKEVDAANEKFKAKRAAMLELDKMVGEMAQKENGSKDS